MFSFKYAIFCMLAGLLAGWSFDKKNDLPIVGIFTYIFVVNAFSLMFDYDQSWAFLAFVEMLAGHGLYKMGFGNFLGELFFNTESKKKVDKVITASKAAKKTYDKTRVNRRIKDNLDINKGLERVNRSESECIKLLSNKGYSVLKTHKGYTIYVKPIIMGVMKDRASNLDELCMLAKNYNQIDY